MKHKLILRGFVVMLVLFSFSTVWADISVTFNADMTVKTQEEAFVPGTDAVTLRSNFMTELGCTSDWFPDEGAYTLADDDADTVYSLTLTFPDSTDGRTYEYKFQINDDVWENGDNHSFVVASPSTVVGPEWFDRDSVVTVATTDSIDVTFQVDLSVKVKEEVFTPGTDNVTIRGSFMDELGLSGDWFPDEGPFFLADEDADTIYSLTLKFPGSLDGLGYEYKYQINDDVWESGDNHTFTVASPATVIDPFYFDNDSVITRLCVNFVHFELDLTTYYGSGSGFFDPSTDSIKIEGFWGPGISEELSDESARWCVENVWQPGIYETVVTIKAEEGLMPEFKAHAKPEDHFENWGWETTDNKTFTVLGDSQDVYISYIPDIVPKLNPLSEDLVILFSVDVSNAANRWAPGVAVDPSTITQVGLKGQNEIIGSWAGSWELSDTVSTDSTSATLLMLNDDGLNGDKTAGDNIWSSNVTFPAGVVGGPCLYKYSIYYPGSDTLYSHDNEMVDGDDNHSIYIDPNYPTEMNDIFGVPSVNGTPVGIEVEPISTIAKTVQLHQNYPNPFNPTTNICFELPGADKITLSVYNMLGQRVETLVNNRMEAGKYTVKFNGAQMASGVYFVRLQTGNQIQTRKMMLLK